MPEEQGEKKKQRYVRIKVISYLDIPVGDGTTPRDAMIEAITIAQKYAHTPFDQIDPKDEQFKTIRHGLLEPLPNETWDIHTDLNFEVRGIKPKILLPIDLDAISGDVLEEVLDQINGHKCDNPDCPVHGKNKRERTDLPNVPGGLLPPTASD